MTGGTEENPDNLCIEEDEYNLFLDMQLIDGLAALDGSGSLDDWHPSKDHSNYECQ